MQIKPIKTHKIEHGESLETLLDSYVANLQEYSILAITSKIISIIEGRYVAKDSIDKYELITQEADFFLETNKNSYDLYLTIKDGLLIPSAGIDESNADNVYVLYPSDVWKSAERIWKYLRTKQNIKHLGIIITDSHTTIMRRGTTGIALSWCGFEPLYSYIGKPDIYNNPLRVTQINIVDALATAAVFVMGEGGEQIPMAIIVDSPHIKFLKNPPSLKDKTNILISAEEDLYAPLLQSATWK